MFFPKGINVPLIVFLIFNSCSFPLFAELAYRKQSLDKGAPFWSFLPLPWSLAQDSKIS